MAQFLFPVSPPLLSLSLPVCLSFFSLESRSLGISIAIVIGTLLGSGSHCHRSFFPHADTVFFFPMCIYNCIISWNYIRSTRACADWRVHCDEKTDQTSARIPAMQSRSRSVYIQEASSTISRYVVTQHRFKIIYLYDVDRTSTSMSTRAHEHEHYAIR